MFVTSRDDRSLREEKIAISNTEDGSVNGAQMLPVRSYFERILHSADSFLSQHRTVGVELLKQSLTGYRWQLGLRNNTTQAKMSD